MKRTILSVTASLAFAIGLGGAAAASASAATDNLIANPGLEVEGVVGAPAWWAPSSWGTNTSTPKWLADDAHTGTHSVRVDLSGYTDGDSKWVPDLVDVKGNTYYNFSDWYKSNRSSAVSVYYVLSTDKDTDGDGQPDGHWANLFSGIAPASDWTQYKTGFTMPANAVRAQFVHFIAGNGWLQTDDYSLTEQASPPGFSKPMISLTFDDGSQGNWDHAQPLLNTKGYTTTQYIPTKGLVDHSDPFLMTEGEVSTLAREGNEIGGHTVTHPMLTQVSDAQLKSELADSKGVLEAIPGVGTVHNFAYPFGDYDARVIQAEKDAGYRSGRSVEEGYNSRLDLEPYDIRVQNMTPDTTLDEFKSWVDYAKVHNYWLVIVYHEVQPDSVNVRCTNPATDPDPCLGDYDATVSQFTDQLNYIDSSGLGPDVMTVQQALDATDAEMRPVAGAVKVTPASPLPGTVLTANPTGFSDPDNDALTYHYQWRVNGTPVAGATGSTFTAGNAGDVVSVDVTASDPGGRTSAGVSDSVTVPAPPSPTPGPVVTPKPTPVAPAPPVTHADKTAPKIVVSSPRARTYKVGRLLKVKLSFSDASGRVTWKATLRRSGAKAHSVKQGSKLRLRRAGRYVLRVTAKDRFGNSATKTVHFRVIRK